MEVEGSRSCETMWRPRKPQPPITRTELGGFEDRAWVMAANGSEAEGSGELELARVRVRGEKQDNPKVPIVSRGINYPESGTEIFSIGGFTV